MSIDRRTGAGEGDRTEETRQDAPVSQAVAPTSWSEYYQATLDKPLHPLYAELDPFLPERGSVLELGCGVGHGVLHLASKGFEVVANDLEDQAIAILRARLADDARIRFAPGSFDEIDWPEFDVVVAGFCLFFLPPERFHRFWPRLVATVRPGGLLAGQLLGVHDDWANRGYTVLSRPEVEALLAPFDLLHFEEVERDGETAMRDPKHWHVFHFVARRKVGAAIRQNEA